MSSSRVGSKRCFVGNIAYDCTEEQLREYFSQAGPVKSFTIMHDHETGRPKGFGFCEFLDAETALSAVRNLNGAEFHSRTLRVDLADASRPLPNRSGGGGGGGGGSGGGSGLNSGGEAPPPMTFSAPPPMAPPPTATVPHGLSPAPAAAAAAAVAAGRDTTDTINDTMNAMTSTDVFELMKQMKAHIQQDPASAQQLLTSNPQLAYALLQALLAMGIVEPAVAQQLLQVVSSTPATNPPPSASSVPPPTAVAAGAASVAPMPPNNQPPPPPSGGQAQPQLTPDEIARQELLARVLAMSPEQIAALPEDQQRSVLQLRHSVGVM